MMAVKVPTGLKGGGNYASGPTTPLRCAKCGSEQGFLIETSEREIKEVKSIGVDRIKKPVLVTCGYCNNRWDHVPWTP